MISSGFLYLGFSQVPLVDDEDAGAVSAGDEVGDFLVLLEDAIDSVEDKNKNGKVDPGETDPKKLDSDGDGISDREETVHGTDRFDDDSFL